jgi:hypothetical protein
LIDVAKRTRTIAKCHDGACPRRADAREGLQFSDSCPVQQQSASRAYPRIIGWPAREREVWGEPIDGIWTDSRHSLQGSDAAERTLRLAIRHDPPSQCGSDPWEALQLAGSRRVGIDPFAHPEGPVPGQRGSKLAEWVAIGRGI